MHIFTLQLYRRCFRNNITCSRWISAKTQMNAVCKRKIVHDDKLLTPEEQLFKKYESSILYSDFIERNRLRLGYQRNVIAMEKLARSQRTLEIERTKDVLPVSLKYLGYAPKQEAKATIVDEPADRAVHLPFKDSNANVMISDQTASETIENTEEVDLAEETKREIRMRLELLNKSTDHLNWMHDYENYPLQMQSEETLGGTSINYGTSNRDIPTSQVPCGGCGALLHCRDSGIPGYIPSEIFESYSVRGGIKLEGIHCQRCHFLEHYNMALQVRVSPEDYPKVLSTIRRQKKALVVLLVDLLDMPCSIWPGIADLIGYGRPIVVVGNKVDLLPDDGKGYLQRVKDHLFNSIREAGLGMTNIQHVALISAKTGFGVEDLITRLHALWQYKGDVYIVGCTNVGKSSLFNLLLQSDYCKHTAADLIQRATTSPWPGTTLNLLRFPIMRPTGWKMYLRHKRLQSTRHLEAEERRLRQKLYVETKDSKYATLIGHIERSLNVDQPLDPLATETINSYAIKGSAKSSGSPNLGIDPSDKRYALGKWCYDTPGVVQPDQMIHHFTTDELVKVLPKNIIKARTFSFPPGNSLLVAGIARMDYLEGEFKCRFTVFASFDLPILICETKLADCIYKDMLNGNALLVPMSNPERLRLWPGLRPSQCFTVTGIDENTSCADLVLSSAGWIAVTPNPAAKCSLQGWTPEGRGIYLRDCLLPNIVRKRGKKIRGMCAYKIN